MVLDSFKIDISLERPRAADRDGGSVSPVEMQNVRGCFGFQAEKCVISGGDIKGIPKISIYKPPTHEGMILAKKLNIVWLFFSQLCFVGGVGV